MMRNLARILLLVALLPGGAYAQQPEDASQLEAVVETSAGSFTMRFFPKEAPLHVAAFLETARKGGYDGTVFHRAVPYGFIQGGDPLSKDPKKKAQYGTGGLKLLPDEINARKHIPGAVSAVAIPGPDGNPLPGSSGSQFFVCDGYMNTLDGKYSVFGWVTEGMDTVRAISIMPKTGDKLNDRVEIRKVTVRPVAPAVEELGKLRARIVTESGEIVWEFLPTAPENARNFIRLARAGYYDGATIYRAVPGMLIQGASSEGWPAESPNKKRSFSVWPLPDEFTASVPFDRGVVGMAHGADPNGATVHWFVLTGRASHLDAKYTPFARVVSGMEAVDAISKMPAPSERLATPVRITRVTIEPAP
jgi:peptidyl-prolyl cis-trans isomerase B (cyclophilin B)